MKIIDNCYYDMWRNLFLKRVYSYRQASVVRSQTSEIK